MENKEKYTFLLPAYKSTFFRNSLLSIKNQTYQNFYVVVSDDCSPEPLKNIFDEVVGMDSRFSYRRNNENLGGKNLVRHWNSLLQFCNTEYFILASDDDLYEERFLEILDSLVCKYPQVSLFRGRSRVIDGNERIILEDSIVSEYSNQAQYLSNLVHSVMNPSIANYIFRTKALKEIGGFVDFPLAWGSDEATFLLLSLNGVAYSREILFSFRQSGLNISSSQNIHIERKKYEARKKYLKFLKYIFYTLSDNTKEDSSLNDVKREYFIRIADQVLYKSYFLSFREFPSHYMFLIRVHVFKSVRESLKYFWTWFRLKQKYNENRIICNNALF